MSAPTQTTASASMRLAAPALKLALVFSAAAGVTLALCSLLLERVRSHDAATPSATHASLDALSLRSVSSLEELQRSHAAFAHVFAVEHALALLCFACIYTIKQTFAIPGSALLNVFAGAMLPLYVALPLVAVLTALGASNCYVLSRTLASEASVTRVCEALVPGKLSQLRAQIETSRARGELLYVLLFLRVFPFSPNWLLNLASPWLQVPLSLFTPSVLLGLLPYNAVTVQAGAMLATLTSTRDLFDPKTLASLVLLALGMLVPALVKHLRARHGTASDPAKPKYE